MDEVDFLADDEAFLTEEVDILMLTVVAFGNLPLEIA